MRSMAGEIKIFIFMPDCDHQMRVRIEFSVRGVKRVGIRDAKPNADTALSAVDQHTEIVVS